MRLLRNHGAERQYFHRMVGGNFRLDALQAAVLRVKAPHLEAWTAGRRRNAARYRALFETAGLLDRVTLPAESPDGLHIYNQFVDQSAVARSREGAASPAPESDPRSTIRCRFIFRSVSPDLGYREGAFPHAEAAARETLALPIYPELSEAQQAHVVETIRRVLSSSSGVLQPAAGGLQPS